MNARKFFGSGLTLAGVALCTSLLAGCGGDHVNDSSMSSATSPPTPAQKCASLVGKSVGDSGTVTSAVVQPAIPASGPNTQVLPEYCAVNVQATDSALVVKAWLPTTAWNSKMLEAGGGGFKGDFFLSTPTGSTTFGVTSPSVITDRYAIVGSNGGHDVSENTNAAFALDPIKLNEYTYLAEHRAAEFGKAVINEFYGQLPTKSYFEGCSTGGHDAMMESQRYPEDFDGIVARAPAGNFIGLYLEFNRISTAVRQPGGLLNSSKQKLVADAVLTKCDALDGLADGIISKPWACTFDPTALRCPGGADSGDTCLSDAQINTVNAITTPLITADGKWSHPGYNWGGENLASGWGQYIWPTATAPSAQQSFSDQWVRGFITKDMTYDPTKFDYNQWLPSLGDLGQMWQAFSPDLSALQQKGGKLILMGYGTDTSVSARDVARYYDSVVKTMGQENADKTVEAFMAPGVGHCGIAQNGPGLIDLIRPLAAWVEQGIPPSQQKLSLQKVDGNGNVTMTKPLCKYPSYPRYNGSGDVNQATSFSCSTE